MKLYIRRDDESNAMIEAMASNFDNQNDAMVGIFWYDVNKNVLSGVNSAYADELTPYNSPSFGGEVKTIRTLREKVWERELHKKCDRRFFGEIIQKYQGAEFFRLMSGL